jgi:hypothetical protein
MLDTRGVANCGCFERPPLIWSGRPDRIQRETSSPRRVGSCPGRPSNVPSLSSRERHAPRHRPGLNPAPPGANVPIGRRRSRRSPRPPGSKWGWRHPIDHLAAARPRPGGRGYLRRGTFASWRNSPAILDTEVARASCRSVPGNVWRRAAAAAQPTRDRRPARRSGAAQVDVGVANGRGSW